MNLLHFVTRADELIAKADTLIASSQNQGMGFRWVDAGLFAELRAAGLSFFDRVFGADHIYFTEYNRYFGGRAEVESAERGRRVLIAARDEIAGGWAVRVKGLVAAELFTDFLDMSQYLLSENYKDAAVMTGAVLEAHLRQLCVVSNVPVTVPTPRGQKPKTADRMNAELAKCRAYGAQDLKNVIA
jgi:hypothetical protein